MGHFHIDARNFPHNHYPLLKALYRAPAQRLAPSLAALRANTISLIGFACGALAALGLARGAILLPLLLLHLSMLLDYVDGEVARYRGESSVLGAWLEIGLDKFQAFLLFLGLTRGAMVAAIDPARAWSWGFAALGAFFLCSVLNSQRHRLIRESLQALRARSNHRAKTSATRVWVVALWRESSPAYVVWLWILTVAMVGSGPLLALQVAAVYGWIQVFLRYLVGLLRALRIDEDRSRESTRLAVEPRGLEPAEPGR